jgi:hypothetical protein
MGTFAKKYTKLEQEVNNKIIQLIAKKGKESKYYSDSVLKLKDDFQFNLGDGRYATEISVDHVIDNNGYQYGHDSLTLEQRCEIIDSFN